MLLLNQGSAAPRRQTPTRIAAAMAPAFHCLPFHHSQKRTLWIIQSLTRPRSCASSRTTGDWDGSETSHLTRLPAVWATCSISLTIATPAASSLIPRQATDAVL